MASIVSSLYVVAVAFQRRIQLRGNALALGVIGTGLAWWALADLLGWAIGGPAGYPGTNCIILPVAMPGITVATAGFYLLARATVDPDGAVKPVVIGLLSIEPVLIIVAGATNSLHHSVISCSAESATGSASIAFGSMFWLHSLYSYVLVGLGVFAVCRNLIRTIDRRKRKMALVIVAVSIPVAGNVVSLSIGPRWPDVTALFFSASAILICVGILRARIFDVLPIARAGVFDLLNEGVVVFDERGRLVDINPTGEELIFGARFEDLPSRPNTETTETELATFTRLIGPPSPDPTIVTWRDRLLEVRFSEVSDARERVLGRALMIWDVTVAHRQREALDATNRALIEKLAQIEELQRDLAYQAARDPLTGLYNRRYLHDVVENRVRGYHENHENISLVIMDIDHFKLINDTFGHHYGDHVLATVADRIADVLGPLDTAARIGGDEIVLILPTTSEDRAAELLQLLGNRLRTTPVEFGSGLTPDTVTFSAGVASTDTTDIDSGEIIPQLLQAADAAMYEAKQRGRNRIVTAADRRRRPNTNHGSALPGGYRGPDVADRLRTATVVVRDVRAAGSRHTITPDPATTSNDDTRR
ncbi:diguanylate cyclase [Rhodococcus sp. 27YEA15]|uniref:histidine kinase N-terminal 7TM domain-containing diguanylate cyclase n=1 Tax=Rhodococcus sp. 27YEA15 TaxID=3156259 RepID=UPI003C7B97D5